MTPVPSTACKYGAVQAPTEQKPIFSWAPVAWFTGERQGQVQRGVLKECHQSFQGMLADKVVIKEHHLSREV